MTRRDLLRAAALAPIAAGLGPMVGEAQAETWSPTGPPAARSVSTLDWPYAIHVGRAWTKAPAGFGVLWSPPAERRGYRGKLGLTYAVDGSALEVRIRGQASGHVYVQSLPANVVGYRPHLRIEGEAVKRLPNDAPFEWLTVELRAAHGEAIGTIYAFEYRQEEWP